MPECGAFARLSAIPLIVCLPSASPLSHRLHHEFEEIIEVHTMTYARCAFGGNWAQRLQIWSTGIDKHDLAFVETRCSRHGDSAVGQENDMNLALAITCHHFPRLCRTLLPMSFVPMLMPDCFTATTHPPSREHPMLRGWVGKVKENVPKCERLGSTSARLCSS